MAVVLNSAVTDSAPKPATVIINSVHASYPPRIKPRKLISISKLAKLRRMGFPELRHRVQEAVQTHSERRQWRRGKRVEPSPVIDLCATELLETVAALYPFGDLPAQTSAFPESDPTRTRLLGFDFNLAQPIDWSSDPRTGYRWPDLFYADLQLYAHSNGTDVKYPWELARHQYFVDLAFGFLRTGNEQHALLVRRLWLDWIERNPLYQGVHWTSALEPAMRAISWIWTLASLRNWAGWTARDLSSITNSMVDHASYLHDHFSYYSSPFNHIIGEASGLYLLAAVLKNHPRSDAWAARAVDVLHEYTPRQFYEDGFGVEQACSYHFYTLGFLALAINAGKESNAPFASIEPIVHQAFRAGISFRRPDGRWPAIGDLDSARAMPIQTGDFWNFDSICEVGAVLFDDADLLPPGNNDGREVRFLFGDAGVQKLHDLGSRRSASRPMILHELSDAGYAVGCAEADWLMLDAGPIAAGLFPDSTPSTAHGHADTLQLLYFADGIPVLEDSGMPFYGGDKDWIRYFRSPAAHNTVEIEGAEYVRSEGSLAWSREVHRPLLTADFSNDVLMCSGEVSWEVAKVSCRRNVLCLPGIGVWVADWIQTALPRSVKWHWQIPANASFHGQTEQVHFEGFCLSRDSGADDVTLVTAMDGDPRGWRCHAYGERSPGSVLTHRRKIQGSALVLTVISREKHPLAVEFKGLAATLSESGDVPRDILVSEHNGCRWRIGDVTC